MTPFNYPILTAAPNTGTVVSAAIDCRFVLYATCQAKFTDSAAAGALKLQGSDDPVSPTNWNDVPNSSVTVTAGATSTTPVLTTPLAYQWLRVAFVSSGGAGTISANLHGEGL